MTMRKALWIRLEEKCGDCHGQGQVYLIETRDFAACSGCEGSGFQENLMTLEEFKKIWEAL